MERLPSNWRKRMSYSIQPKIARKTRAIVIYCPDNEELQKVSEAIRNALKQLSL